MANQNTFDQGDTWKRNIRETDADFSCRPDGTRPDWFWTGRKPEAGVPGIQADGSLQSLPTPNLATAQKADVVAFFDNGWLITETLFSGLDGLEPFYRPPYHNLRHPLIFYYAHAAALFVNKLRVAGLLSEGVNAHFEHIFETGVDEMGWDDLSKNDMLWPQVKEVTEYRRTVYGLVRKAILDSPVIGYRTVTWDDPEWALFMGCEHERIHIETTSVLIRELPQRLVQQPYCWPPQHQCLEKAIAAPPNLLVPVAAGAVTIGKPADEPTYGWDNEYGSRVVPVGEFEATRYQVTNGEMLEFVKAGGYREEALWTSDGWRWRTFRNAKWPPFWSLAGPAGLHQYSLRTIWRSQPLPLAAPALVNVHEARAFAEWRTRSEPPSAPPLRLLSEAEHHRLRAVSGQQRGVLQLAFGSEVPVDCAGEGWTLDAVLSGAPAKPNQAKVTAAVVEVTPPSSGDSGSDKENAVAGNAEVVAKSGQCAFPGVMGNAWHWCEDWFSALPGNRGVHPTYDDFSAPCYDGQHNLIMGGSFMSTGAEATPYARFHFRPHFHQQAGFRLARSAAPPLLSHIDSPPPHVGSWNPSSRAPPAAATDAAALGRALLSQYPASPAAAALAAKPLVAAGLVQDPAALDFGKLAAGLLADALGAEAETADVFEIGCGVGGLTFELAEKVAKVVAIDLSAEAIAAATRMQADGRHEATVRVEGTVDMTVTLPRRAGAAAARRVTFKQMDPCCIAPDIGVFGAAVVNCVLDACVSPKAPLGRLGGMHAIVAPGGLVLVLTANDWSPERSDAAVWLGGRPGMDNTTHDAIAAALGPDFAAVSESVLPRISREHARKFTVHLVDALLFRRTE